MNQPPTAKNDHSFWSFVLLAYFPLWLCYRLGELLRFARAAARGLRSDTTG